MKVFTGFTKLLLVLLIGGIGGILLERTLIPWLAQHEPFSRIPSLTIERTTIVNPTTETIIDEAQALERAVGAVRPQLVAVERQNSSGTALSAASGVILSSDGVVVTSGEVVGQAGVYVVYRDREALPATLLANDAESGLALLSVDVTRWPITEYGEPRDRALGKRVFLLSQEHLAEEEDLATTLTQGIVAQVLADGLLGVDIPLEEHMPGASVFTLEGRLLGIVVDGELVGYDAVRTLFDETDRPRDDFSAALFR
jgi:S1-C subfamily serine protease